MADTLPEGTNRITPGASSTTPSPSNASPAGPGDKVRGDASDLKAKAQAKAGEWRDQAADHAREYADQGKEKASGALTNVARLIDDNAVQIDDRLGAQYGDYARRASTFVSDAAESLREKDIEELLDDARAFVRRSPGVAIAAAAATGLLAARVVKAGTAPVSSAPTPRKGGQTPNARRKSSFG